MPDTPSTVSPFPLGPFDVFERIGAGGMGIVYRALHRASATEVAVKVVRGDPDDRARRRFRREVQAHAALNHPFIVQLLEYGRVDQAAFEASDGALAPGSPYVGMELADGGTVWSLGIDSWPRLRSALRQVLVALGHAHARGVIHRDLKPGNLLVFRQAEDQRVKLTDFGIAHALAAIGERGHDSLRSVIGTPKYMAPEQLLGRWREHGPWTDIYALGCIAYRLVTGNPPYEDVDRGGVRQAVAHLSEPPPPIQPRFGIPDGLRDWIRTAMETAPEDRFRRASEALAVLPDAEASTMRAPSGAVAPTPGSAATPTTTADTVVLDQSQREAPLVASARPRTAPPPEQWRPFCEPSGSLRGAGLSLIGLRQPAYVGREAERDTIWETFRRVVDTSDFEVVLLEGEAGIGKTRLAEWATTLAHEIGSATILRLEDVSRSLQGVEEVLRTWKMSREQVYAHLRRTLPPLGDEDTSRDYDVAVLTTMLRPDPSREGGGSGFEFFSPRERVDVLQRLVRRLASRRPVVVSIDDLHDAGLTIGLLEHLVDSPPDGVLVLATMRTDILAARPDLATRIDALADRDAVTRLTIGPLSVAEQRQLTRQLSLSESATELLVERMEGNPLFGVQLLTDWVERGLLRSTDQAIAAPEKLDELPADIHAVWLERIQRLEERLDDPEQFRRSLELAAVSGKRVSRQDWAAMIRHDDEVVPNLWERLVARGLARHTESGWRFGHGLFVTTLHRLAREAGRWEDHHRHWAEALTPRFRREPLRVARRLADHWMAAGHPERALGPLMEEVERLQREDTAAACVETLLLRQELLDELGVPPDDLQRLRNDLALLRTNFRLGVKPADIYEGAMAVLERLEGRSASELEAAAWQLAGKARLGQANVRDARRCVARAIAAAKASGNRREMATAALQLGRIELQSARAAEAGALAEEVRELALELDDRYLLLRASLLAGWGNWNAGEYETAERYFREALREARQMGNRAIQADCMNGLGEIARCRWETDQAARYYGAARRLYRDIEQPDDAAIVTMNLAIVDIQAGAYDEARSRLDSAASQLEERGYDFVQNYVQLTRLAIAAGKQRWEEFDERLQDVTFLLLDGPVRGIHHDDLWLAELILRLLEESGEKEPMERMSDFVARLTDELERRNTDES